MVEGVVRPSIGGNGKPLSCLAVVLVRKYITSNAHNAQHGQEINLSSRKWITTSCVLLVGGGLGGWWGRRIICWQPQQFRHVMLSVCYLAAYPRAVNRWWDFKNTSQWWHIAAAAKSVIQTQHRQAGRALRHKNSSLINTFLRAQVETYPSIQCF